MSRRPLPRYASVRPVGEALLAAVDDTLVELGFPQRGDLSRMGPLLVRLSAAYNDPTPEGLRRLGPTAIAPRLAFSLARDVPKVTGAVRELLAAGLLDGPVDRPLRVLDIGAGLGASTFGLVHALAFRSDGRPVDATWFDVDRHALDAGARLLRHVARHRAFGEVTPTVSVHEGGMDAALAHPSRDHDVVLLGQVLSEMDRPEPDDVRLARHVALVRRLLSEKVAKDGTLVIVEPALRDRTRHLHAIRDRVIADGVANVFAPCLHEGPCPMLANPDDWCHEDLDVDLPESVAPLARAAGLRFQGLTFSYLVLRRDGLSSRNAAAAGALRVVSKPFVTKGKREAVLCGERGASARGSRVPVCSTVKLPKEIRTSRMRPVATCSRSNLTRRRRPCGFDRRHA
ncbi:MAG: small ribosomal subunit Rsm22 family protein [Polyangiaceae bacterium]